MAALLGCARPPAQTEAPKAADPPTARRLVLDLLEDGAACAIGHQGVFFDLGDPALAPRMSGLRLDSAKADVRERDGATWLGVHQRTLEFSFVTTEEWPGDSIVVEARVRGGTARSISVSVSGRRLGTLSLKKGETTVVSVRGAGAVALGSNTLTLRMNGVARAGSDQLAEIDWVRVGPRDSEGTYAAPTRADVVATGGVNKQGTRGFSLRSPGSVRCAGFVPKEAVFEALVGATGGEADAEVRWIVDRAEPRVLGRFHVGAPCTEGDAECAKCDDATGRTCATSTRRVALPITGPDNVSEGGSVGFIELIAKTAPKGARVFFGEPRVTVSPDVVPPSPSRARGVVVVIVGSLARESLSLYGGPTPMPELAELASHGTVFMAHRTVTSVASGAVASMLTGQLPAEHGVDEPEARLSEEGTTIATALRQAGIRGAMFTENPTTAAAFGVGRGFETFVSSEGAGRAFEDAARWIAAHKEEPFFVVVHARGGHPPWAISAEDVKELPPAGYAGAVDPLRAGELLARARKSGGRAPSEADKQRMSALYTHAAVAVDSSLGSLVAEVRRAGREADTAWIVTGDVGVDLSARVPFLEDEGLEEPALALPLVTRSVGRSVPRSAVPTSSVDVARSVFAAFGLAPPSALGGEDLRLLGDRGHVPMGRMLVASTTTRFSLRLGGFALLGARDRETKLCVLGAGTGCVADARAAYPIAAEVLHAKGFRVWSEHPHRAPSPRVEPDATLAAALRAWGR